jgi:hypothetical protein
MSTYAETSAYEAELAKHGPCGCDTACAEELGEGFGNEKPNGAGACVAKAKYWGCQSAARRVAPPGSEDRE